MGDKDCETPGDFRQDGDILVARLRRAALRFDGVPPELAARTRALFADRRLATAATSPDAGRSSAADLGPPPRRS